MPDDTGLIRLRATSKVPVSTPFRVEQPGQAYAIFTLNVRCFITKDECTHGPGSLAEGWVEDEEVECPFHQGRFNIPTGVPTAPPRTVLLRIWPVRLVDGDIWIDTNSD